MNESGQLHALAIFVSRKESLVSQEMRWWVWPKPYKNFIWSVWLLIIVTWTLSNNFIFNYYNNKFLKNLQICSISKMAAAWNQASYYSFNSHWHQLCTYFQQNIQHCTFKYQQHASTTLSKNNRLSSWLYYCAVW